MTVENVADVPCILLPAPEIAIFDATGAVVLSSQPDVPDEPPPTLEPASTASFSFQMSNWCDESAALPFRVTVVMTDAPAPI